MRYTVASDKPVAQLLEDLKEAVSAHEFGVLNVHDLRQTLKNKGHDLSRACYILDVCNPQQAIKVLNEDMGMNVALPCRISVYEDGAGSKIGMIKPAAMLSALSDSADLAAVAGEVEATMLAIIDDAK
jgi:uncharacterized protein (DUF302 family)